MCQDLTENQTCCQIQNLSLHQIVNDFYDSSELTGLQRLKQNICPFNRLEFYSLAVLENGNLNTCEGITD